jgi:hypothetical protein
VVAIVLRSFAFEGVLGQLSGAHAPFAGLRFLGAATDDLALDPILAPGKINLLCGEEPSSEASSILPLRFRGGHRARERVVIIILARCLVLQRRSLP